MDLMPKSASRSKLPDTDTAFLLLISWLGLIVFLGMAFFTPFSNGLFANLFAKPNTQAAGHYLPLQQADITSCSKSSQCSAISSALTKAQIGDSFGIVKGDQTLPLQMATPQPTTKSTSKGGSPSSLSWIPSSIKKIVSPSQDKHNQMLVSCLNCPISTATTFSLATDQTNYSVGPNISVKLQVKTDTDSSNLYVAKLTFPPNLIQVSSIDTSGSFINNWVDQSYDNAAGTISIIGGIPNPGYQTSSGQLALIATINIKLLSNSTSLINFDASNSAIFRNSDNQNIFAGSTGLLFTPQ